MTLFERLQDHYRVQPDRRDECWIDCPDCGKGDKHCSFSERGYKCFACGGKGSLTTLARKVGIWSGDNQVAAPRVLPAPKAEPLVPWKANTVSILARLCSHPQRMERWQAYKPISRETILRHQFGYGQIPGWSGDWLVVPVVEDGAVIALRGRVPAGETRATAEGKPLKWISSPGSRYGLWNIDGVRTQVRSLWICENYVDAAWLMECYPEYDAVALGGASNWREDWAQAVAAKRPQLVVVALDHDLAGQATGAMYARLLAERRHEHPGLPDLVPNGPKVANSLVALGVPVRLLRYPAEAPAKADVGWLLMQERRMAA